MKIYFVYKSVSRVSGQFYVGVHGTEDISDGYTGTGKLVRYHKKKYGRDVMQVESRIMCKNADEAFALEQMIVDETLLSHPMCLNLALGGRGGEHLRQRKPYKKRKGVPHTPESKANISKAKSKTSPETSKRMSESAKARLTPLVCPHCGHKGTAPNIRRWHFSNCKQVGVF